MQLSPHFTLEEMLESETAEARHISNVANEEAISNLKALCLNVLEPLREAYGKPIDINSGYRCPALNRAVGGSRTSQHLKGQACDLVGATHGDLIKLFNLIQSLGLPFDQLIAERFDPRKEKMPATARGWIHVSYRADGKNRGQILYR